MSLTFGQLIKRKPNPSTPNLRSKTETMTKQSTCVEVLSHFPINNKDKQNSLALQRECCLRGLRGQNLISHVTYSYEMVLFFLYKCDQYVEKYEDYFL